MALDITIYNLQKLTSRSGKEYMGRAIAFTPGQRGAIPAACEQPPFYTREQRNGETSWNRLQARLLAEARTEALQVQAVQEARAKGVDVVASPEESRERLTNKIAAYLAEVEANKSKATWNAYRKSTELFLKSSTKLNVNDVERTDMLHFKTYLKKEDYSGRSIFNHFANITIFFVWAKGEENTLGLKQSDWPEKPERDPEAYSQEEIKTLFQMAAKTFRGLERNKGEERDDRLLLDAFVNSGMREGELAHLTYGDIDAKHSVWKVRAKEVHNLKTKGSKRDVPVGEWLTAKVMERKKSDGRQDTDLIFPISSGGVDTHLIRVTQRIAKLACLTGRGDNHKVRATAITK